MALLCFLFQQFGTLFWKTLGFSSMVSVLLGVFAALSGQTFMRSNAMFIAMLPYHEKRGAAGALFSSFQTLVAFLSSAAVSPFFSPGVEILSLLYLALGLSAYILYFTLIKSG